MHDGLLELTLLGHRCNCFGPVHLPDPICHWLGPNCWRTKDALWTKSYRLKQLGLLSTPQRGKMKIESGQLFRQLKSPKTCRPERAERV